MLMPLFAAFDAELSAAIIFDAAFRYGLLIISLFAFADDDGHFRADY